MLLAEKIQAVVGEHTDLAKIRELHTGASIWPCKLNNFAESTLHNRFSKFEECSKLCV